MKINRVFGYLFLFVIIALFFWWHEETRPISHTTTPQSFIVAKGEGVKAIGQQLKAQGLIKSPLAFYFIVKHLGLDNKIQAGEFRLSPNETPETIAKMLTTGSLDVWITIPEGKRAEEIADILQEKLPTYQDSWRQILDTKEGYLFPDTYLIARDATLDTILTTFQSNFDEKYDQLVAQYHPTLSQQKLVTIASLIEREAKYPEDRPLVASVIYNRLNDGMALQLDATVQYALGTESLWWKNNLTDTDLHTDSAYNTYINTGLPPTPIANPGVESLRAAMNPAKTSYFYYISDSSGHNHYARTNAEQEANISKYGL